MRIKREAWTCADIVNVSILKNHELRTLWRTKTEIDSCGMSLLWFQGCTQKERKKKKTVSHMRPSRFLRQRIFRTIIEFDSYLAMAQRFNSCNCELTRRTKKRVFCGLKLKFSHLMLLSLWRLFAINSRKLF